MIAARSWEWGGHFDQHVATLDTTAMTSSMSIGNHADAVAPPSSRREEAQPAAPWPGAKQRVAAHGMRLRALALLRAARPRQWSKNLLVVAAPGAAGVLLHREVPGRVGLTFIAFCLLASSTYLFNDLRDRAEDALHPRKRLRPIASGELPITQALPAAVLFAAAGLALTAYIGVSLLALAAGYLALTASYTLVWRHVAVADIAVVASGFVIRALAGGVATGVSLSRWFVIVTSFGALFLVAGKRYAELTRALAEREQTGEDGVAHAQEGRPRLIREGESMRNALYSYTVPYLRFVMILAASVAVGAYCLWAFQYRAHGTGALYDLTILPFVLWLLRYALLLDSGAGEAPEDLLLTDPFLLVSAVVWVGLFAGSVYVGG